MRLWGRVLRGRRGYIIPVVMAVGAVLTALVFALFQYQSHRVWITGATVNDVSALAAAEAGISCVMAEIRISPEFRTHELEGFDPDGTPRWGAEVRRRPSLESRADAGLIVEKSSTGTYQGAVGTHPYQAHFKVRAGYLPRLDRNGDDSTRDLFLEAIGFRQDPTKRQDRATLVRVLAERSNFTEFVLYDGEWVTIGMGSSQDPDEYNIFADGRLYGHRWVHLGNIPGGTWQKFINLSSIRSAGQIRTWDPYKVVFRPLTTPSGLPADEEAFAVDLTPAVDSDGPSPVETGRGRILDGSNGGEIPPPPLRMETYQRLAREGGIDLDGTRTPETREWHSYPEFDGVEFVTLDFGRARYADGEGDDSGETGLGAAYPGNFNGIVYSTKSVMVRGAPDRDVTVVSAGDVFVDGDFNVRETLRQDYKRGYEPAGGGDGDTAVPDARYYDYLEPERFSDEDGERLPPEESDRMSCALVAQGRVWRDYRLPGHPFGNEVKALLAYEIGRALGSLSGDALDGVDMADQAAVEAAMREYGHNWTRIEPETVEIQVPGYESSPGPLTDWDGDGVLDLPAGAGVVGGMFPISKPDAEDPSGAEFKLYPGQEEGDPEVQQILTEDLARPHYFSHEKAPHYWKDWTVTEETRGKIVEAIHEALEASRGKVTPALLWGEAPEAGLLDRLYDAMLEDQKHFSDHKGMGFYGGTPPENSSRLALANAVQRLYELVRDDQGPDGEAGVFSDDGGTNRDMMEDRLWMPQMTVNAMLFMNAPRNDANVPDGVLDPAKEDDEADPSKVNRRFQDLGNALLEGLHYLTAVDRMGASSQNVRAPFVQRIRGALIRLARGPVVAPRTEGGYYWPPIRRRIFDPDLERHPPPGVPNQVLIKSWQNLGATKADFERY